MSFNPLPARARYRQWWPLLAAGSLLVLAIVLALFLLPNDDRSFVQGVRDEVCANVPLGSTRAEVESWISRRYGFIPSYTTDLSADRIQGKTITELLGRPADEYGAMIRTVAPREGHSGYFFNQIRPNHVFVYFLLDHEGRLKTCYFLSLKQLAAMEAAAVREKGAAE